LAWLGVRTVPAVRADAGTGEQRPGLVPPRSRRCLAAASLGVNILLDILAVWAFLNLLVCVAGWLNMRGRDGREARPAIERENQRESQQAVKR
jgi:hypothetical protein